MKIPQALPITMVMPGFTTAQPRGLRADTTGVNWQVLGVAGVKEIFRLQVEH